MKRNFPKQSDPDHDRYRFRGNVRQPRGGVQTRSQRHEDVEARINRAAFRRTMSKGLKLFPIVSFLCVVAAMVVFYSIAALDNPDAGFWDVVWTNLGWILLSGFGMGFVWSVSYLLRGGVSVSRQWTMIWQYSFPWRGRDGNLRDKP